MGDRGLKILIAAPGLFPALSGFFTFPFFCGWNEDAVTDLICEML